MDSTERMAREHAARDKDRSAKSQEAMQTDAYKQLNTLYQVDERIKMYIKHLLAVDEWAHNHSDTTFAWRQEVDGAFKELGRDFEGSLNKLEYQRHSAESDVMKEAKAELLADRKAIG